MSDGAGRGVLVLFAKEPRPGRVKTRLCPPLSPESAAHLYESMLLDIVDQRAGGADVDLAVCFTPAEARPWFQRHLPVDYTLSAQQGESLAARMRAAFNAYAEAGYGRIVLRGTDSPTLPDARTFDAFSALEEADLVLCPDLDGGYNLIGLREPRDELFEIEMSTGSVLEQTQAGAERLGLRQVVLPGHHDVDHWSDLRRLDANDSLDRAPRTRRWLAEKSPR